MIGKSITAVGQFLGITLVTLLIYLGGFFLTSFILLGTSAGPLTGWLGLLSFGVMIIFISAFRAWTIAKPLGADYMWEIFIIGVNYPWKIFTINIILLIVGVIVNLAMVALADGFNAKVGYSYSPLVMSLTIAAVYSLLILCIELIVLWWHGKTAATWLAAGWTANSAWWTMYIILLLMLADD